MDYSRARAAMVESQIRTADVTTPAIVAAFRRLPRENFLPAASKAIAYGDLEPEAAPGRTLLRPRDLAKLVQALAPTPGEKALEIAGATGYGAAILAACTGEAVTLDPNPDLSFSVNTACEQSGVSNVTAVSTEAAFGWADNAPYNVILLNGSTEIVPQAWLDQLAEGGRLGVIVRSGPSGQARIYVKSGGATAYHVAFDAAPPIAPGLAAKRSFAF
jgi:protein-L-isoaspartate(D-aspartate) O-methyltransferase